VDGVLAHAGRIAWDELVLIGVFAIPLIAVVVYLASKLIRSDR
jgi:hypothetical protein